MSPDPDGAGSLEQDLQMNWNGGAADNGSLIGLKAAGQQNFNRTYSYDSLNRLAAMSDSNTSQQCRGLSWTYDAWGNRTDQTQTAGTCNSFHQSVNTKNQLVDTINNTLQYDAAGNMTYDGNHSYTYDAENRLIQVDGGSTASYVYDAVGHRVTKTVSGAWRDYLYDTSGNVVAETTSGGWNVGYAYLGGQLLAQYSNSTTYFVHQDHLGSTRLRTTLSQSVYDSFDYLPFGELLSGAGDYVHKFTGEDRDDETGLDHTWFRQYSSSLGRWMHPDPAGLAAVDPSNPQSWNRYAYVLNNPLALIDPLGLADDGCDPSNNGDQPCPKNVTENDSGGMEGSGCAADGIAISCGWAWSLVYSGAAVPCPNNNCGPVSSQGQLWFFKVSTNGNGAYFPVEGPGWNFSSEAEALAAGALWAAAATRDNGIENCGMTYSAGNGQYSFTGSVEGHLASCQPLNASSLVPSGDPADGGYHSHPNDPNYYHERFSGQPGDYPGLGGDVGWAFSNNLPFGYPLSLGTPEGRLIIYYPAGNCQVFAKGSPVGTGTTIPICH